MLHVKHGHMLMQSQFKPFRRRGAEQVRHLFRVQVVREGEIFQPPPFFQDSRAIRIGDIQGKIPNAAQGGMAEVLRRAQVADEDAVRLRPFHELKVTGFRRLLDAGRRQKDGDAVRVLPNRFHSRRIVPEVFKVQINGIRPGIQNGRYLFRSAAQHRQVRRCVRSCRPPPEARKG